MYPISVANRRINADQIESVEEISRGLRLHMASGEVIHVIVPGEVQVVRDVFNERFAEVETSEEIPASDIVPAGATVQPKQRKAKAHD